MRAGFLLGLAMLGAAAAAEADCQLERVATLPAKVDNGRVFIPGAIDGVPVDYMVDLASRTVLLRIAAEKMEVHPTLGVLDKPATFGEPDQDQFLFKNLPLVVTGTAENFGAPQQVALLGMDFFGHYDVEFDVQHGKIVLYRPTSCAAAEQAAWSGPHTEADMVPNPPHTNIQPLNSYNYPHINIRLKVDGRDLLAALDTGYSRSSLSLSTALSLGLEVDGPGVIETQPTADILEGFTTTTWVGSVRSVDLGREAIPHARIDFRTFKLPPGVAQPELGSNLGPVRYKGDDMMLGADFLIAHRVLISQSQSKIYFAPAGGETFLSGRPVDVGSPAVGRQAY